MITGVELLRLGPQRQPGGLLDLRIHTRGVLRLRHGLEVLGTANIAGATILGCGVLVRSRGAVVVSSGVLLAANVGQALNYPWGRDGADEMSLMVLTVVFLSHAFPELRESLLVFLAGVLLVSYSSSGIAKALGPDWRSGNAIPRIMRTRAFGSPRGAALTSLRPILLRVASALMITGESAFPLIIFAPRPIQKAAIAAANVSHLTLAGLMKLNRFAPAFGAAHVALWWTLDSTPAMFWRVRPRRNR